MAIPKKIHFFWHSAPPYPDKVNRCIESWKKMMPDYEIKAWNINSVDLNMLIYTKQAMICKEYAFISDVIRLYALYTEGGIYFDTDVEVFKSFDDLLDQKSFMGIECTGKVGTCVIGSEKGNPVIKEFLDYYKDRLFIKEDGNMEKVANTIPITRILFTHGLKIEDRIQFLKNITIYPESYFCPKFYWESEIKRTSYTYCVHHFDGSWNDNAKVDLPYIANVPKMLADMINKNPKVAVGQSEIIIYGTGDVGVHVLRLLRSNYPKVKCNCFMVTKNDTLCHDIYGMPIIEINQATQKQKDALVIVATTPKYHEVIIKTLKENNFEYIY